MWNKLWIAVALTTLVACGGNTQKKKTADGAATTTEAPDMHNAENSLDYKGIYTGTIPAADAPGIEVRLELKDNGTYLMHMKFIDRESEFDEVGAYAVKVNTLVLTPESGEGISYYKVEENRLRMLDADKQPIAGELSELYILTKTTE
ncbi:copper resistance protein NlpE [uncultured Alistipes sp.]|jgi:hypothetical protein|uniref:copper resistance protein NlpE n=1 Tax=uncultured Alistipes sp. TaxID=538949 RepID=UPI0025EE23B0|nr:copper resistance protein NlpE [uncultured Alistipes sp.]